MLLVSLSPFTHLQELASTQVMIPGKLPPAHQDQAPYAYSCPTQILPFLVYSIPLAVIG